MEKKNIFKVKDWLDFLAYISVVLLPVLFTLLMLCSDKLRFDKELRYSTILPFSACYLCIHAVKEDAVLKCGATILIWMIGFSAIFYIFPVWVLAIYLVFPTLWAIRKLWRFLHER